MKHDRFPETVAVMLTVEDGVETLDVDFLPEGFDTDGEVALYQLKSVGKLERTFTEESA